MRRLVLLALLLGLPGALALAGKAEPEADGKQSKPELRLRVSTHSGIIPLDLKLKGRLIGVDLEEIKACTVRSEWTYDSPAGFEFKSSIEEVPCAADDEPGSIPEKFEKKLLIEQPGTYSYRIILEPMDGRRRAGTSQEVRVFKSKLEMSVRTKESFEVSAENRP